MMKTPKKHKLILNTLNIVSKEDKNLWFIMDNFLFYNVIYL
jgi:hypothetical protein